MERDTSSVIPHTLFDVSVQLSDIPPDPRVAAGGDDGTVLWLAAETDFYEPERSHTLVLDTEGEPGKRYGFFVLEEDVDAVTPEGGVQEALDNFRDDKAVVVNLDNSPDTHVGVAARLLFPDNDFHDIDERYFCVGVGPRESMKRVANHWRFDLFQEGYIAR